MKPIVRPLSPTAWFCPKPWYVSDARMDLRPGGEFPLVMNGPNGESFVNAGVFLEIEPRRRLVSTEALRPGWIPSGRTFMVAETLFENMGNERTRYIARAMHWDRTTLEEHERMGFHEGWGKSVDQIESLARSLPSAGPAPTPAPGVRTCLWFDDQALPAAETYCALVPDSRVERIGFTARPLPTPGCPTTLNRHYTLDFENHLYDCDPEAATRCILRRRSAHAKAIRLVTTSGQGLARIGAVHCAP